MNLQVNQHVMPKLNRRAFVIGTATAGAGSRSASICRSAVPPWCAQPTARLRSTPGS